MRRWRDIAACCAAAALTAACMDYGPLDEEAFATSGRGVFITCEGNFTWDNASLSYYDPATRQLENEVFIRANGMKLGDVAQSMSLHDGRAYVVVNNSGAVYEIDPATFRLKGIIEGVVSPRYLLFPNDTTLYVTDLYDPRITVVDSRTNRIRGHIQTNGHKSTEQMVQWGDEVFVNCWSYDDKILVVDAARETLVDSIEVGPQPSSLVLDRFGKLWTVTDGRTAGIPAALYRIDAETYMLCVNAANIEKDWNHICEEGRAFGMEAGSGKQLYNASDEICQLAVQGPLAMKIVQKMCDEPVEQMEYYTFRKMKVAGVDAILSITGYTGSGGCEIYVANEVGEQLWKALWEAGAEYGLKNIGLGARDTLRLEKGFCLYGNDIDDTTSPLEAGLGWITKFAEGKDFIDRPLLERQKAEGLKRRLVGFRMVERGVPRHGYELAAPDGTIIGHVTSGTMSPCLKVGIGMGYVQTAYSKPGSEIAVVIRGKAVKAEVVRIPFV